MIHQTEIILKPRPRGFHLISSEVEAALPTLPYEGLLHLFLTHTSAGLVLTENTDPAVRTDLDTIFDRHVPDGPDYAHDDEGADDMPAHAKAILSGCSLTIPIRHGKLALGRWQGLCLAEFRLRASSRRIIATIVS